MTDSFLFRKYNIPGPRYTSYPTVPYWSHSPTTESWLENINLALKQSRHSRVGAAIYIHIPFCEKLCTYCGCNTRITKNHSVSNTYIQTVLQELALYSEQLSEEILLSDLHLGGGTPTFMSPSELEELVNGIVAQVGIVGDKEFSIEVDPRVTTEEHIRVLSHLGFRRLSLGVQDFDSQVQKIVHRIQSEDQVRILTESARKFGFTSISYDLIYGLPLQTLESIEKTMQTVIKLKPDRIAFYGYAHVPWIKPSQRRFSESDLPVGDKKRQLYELGRFFLEKSGYIEVGMDHFALPSDSLWIASQEKTIHRNFMGYTSRLVSPLIGLGVSAIGDSWTAFAQNEKILEHYQNQVQKGKLPIVRGHLLNKEDQIIRRHILNLMTYLETSWIDPELQTSFLKTTQERLLELEIDGLVQLSDQSCRITSLGRPFMRNICMAFDARLINSTPSTSLFSQTI